MIVNALVFACRYILWLLYPAASTRVFAWFLRSRGAKLKGSPRYISAKAWIDGGDYSLISIGEGCTISSNVRILTHDWAATTVAGAFGVSPDKPIGAVRPVKIGDFAFVGTNSVLLPGTRVGKGAVVGAGSVVRGKVKDYAVVAGNPAEVIGNTASLVRIHGQMAVTSDKAFRDSEAAR